jgi:hypothetical protein
LLLSCFVNLATASHAFREPPYAIQTPIDADNWTCPAHLPLSRLSVPFTCPMIGALSLDGRKSLAATTDLKSVPVHILKHRDDARSDLILRYQEPPQDVNGAREYLHAQVFKGPPGIAHKSDAKASLRGIAGTATARQRDPSQHGKCMNDGSHLLAVPHRVADKVPDLMRPDRYGPGVPHGIRARRWKLVAKRSARVRFYGLRVIAKVWRKETKQV